MDAFAETLLKKIDQIAGLADQLPESKLREQLVDQIAALNKAITEHGKGRAGADLSHDSTKRRTPEKVRSAPA